MLISNKKQYILASVILTLGFCLFLPVRTQAAISPEIRQVKTSDSPAVYFLSHKYHLKKAYINETSYLNYGNKWSDIRVVSASDLEDWPEAKLFKTADSPAVYYINKGQRAKIISWTDLEDFSLSGQPILEVSQTDLEQYRLVSYSDIGLTKASDLMVFSDLVTGANNNTMITGTDGNLAGVFRFHSPSGTATITSLTIDVKGVYSGSILRGAFLQDESDAAYEANVNTNTSARQIYVSFHHPLTLSAGEEKTIKVFLNFGSCSCNNQTLYLEIKSASDINSSLPVNASFPLQGTTFKLLSGDNILGKLRSQEESLANTSLAVNSGSRLIGKFNFYEDGGQEDVIIKTLTFTNNGSAGEDDWGDFRLLRNGSVVARASEVNDDGDIFFDVNYLRIKHDQPSEMEIIASLKSDYKTKNTLDLSLSGLWAVGTTYNLSLQPQLDNISEVFALN